MENFIEQARRLGHDVEQLKQGEMVEKKLNIKDIDELKELFSNEGESKETRKSRARNLEEEHFSSDAEKLTKKAQNYVFADGLLTEQDRLFMKSSFPMTINSVSVQDKTLAPGEVWDLGMTTSPVVVNLGTLTMEPGSSIKIANTVLKFSVETLIRNAGSTPGANYDLGIFGVTGVTPPQADQGTDGKDGDNGAAGTCQSGGGIAGDDGKDGANGNNGGNGNDGHTGGNGLPSLAANITIGQGGISGSAGQFVIATQSGAGGQGGQGGKGGKGGAGGKGGNGATCGCEHTSGGDGGDGGNGGNGGDGGIGGDAVNGSDIYVIVPSGQGNKIVKQPLSATPGNGGIGGNGGEPGSGGAKGKKGGASGCPSGNNGKAGNPGSAGNAGGNGKPGTQTGAPGTIFITES